MKKNFLIAGALLTSLFMASCSEDDGPAYEKPQTVERAIKPNTEMYSQMLFDDEVIEEAIDSVINFGTDEHPALFYVNQSHKVGGVEVPAGLADLNHSFFTLNREEHENFIRIFAVAWGVTHHTNLTLENKIRAYQDLAGFLKSNNIELAQLVYLCQGRADRLEATIQIADEFKTTRATSQNTMALNHLYNNMLRNNVDPIAYYQEIKKIGFPEDETSISRGPSASTVTSVIKAVVKGTVYLSKFVVAFVKNGKPVVDIKNQYTSYLHQDELDVMEYIDPERKETGTYEYRYGSKSLPMAQIKFSIESYYNSKRKNDNGRYISRIGMIVSKVKATAGMHVTGETTFNPGVFRFAGDSIIAIGGGEVNISYGDCCCNNRSGRVRFEVDGKNGYKKTN